MVEARYISTCTIRPATTSHNNESTQRIELTPWDLRLLTIHHIQKGLLFFKPTPHQLGINKEANTISIINHLQMSLSRTLDYFFPFAGRLATTLYEDNTTSVFIDCNAMGAMFIHAAADITMADILDPLYVPRVVHSFFPLNRVINYDGRSQPLLAVQVTELADGIFIGCAVNHMVADGTSFWHFFNSWSEISRGADRISRLPFFKSSFPSNTTDLPIRFSIHDHEIFLAESSTSPPLEERIFHFTQEKIASLKEKANSEYGGTSRISSLQALLGHVWIAATRARCFDVDQETIYRLAINNRARLKPPLPEDYFGNCIQGVAATAKAGELLERGLGWGAWLLNQVVASHSDAVVRSYMESWIKKPIFMSFNKLASNTLCTGSSPRFNVYGNDFGWGRPIAVRSGCGNKFDGSMTVYPGPVEGSVDVEACLLPETLRAMENDAEFMEAVTILPTFQGI